MAGFISGNATLSAGSVSSAALADDAVTLAKIASGAVSTAALADNAVTLAKMAGGTDGNLIGIDASGDPAYIATGDDGQVLTSGGTGVAALMEAAGGGGLIFINTVVASDDATIGISGLTSTYSQYLIIGSQLRPATDNVEAQMRFGDSGGIDSGGSDYSWTSHTQDDTTREVSGSVGNAFMSLSGTAPVQDIGNAALEGISFEATLIMNDAGGGVPKMFGIGQFSDFNDVQEQIWFSGQHNSAITLTQIQFYFVSGNVTTGRLTVWGYKQS